MVNENSTEKNKKTKNSEIKAFSMAHSLTDVDFANGWKTREMQSPII